MKKSDVIRMVAEKEGLTLKMAESAVNTIFKSIEQALAQGDRVEIRGFGSFQVKDYEGYDGMLSTRPKEGPISAQVQKWGYLT